MESTVREAKQRGYTTTIFGRRRQITELSSDNFRIRQMGERMAQNAPVQGSAADVFKLAMIDVDRALDDGGFRTRMLLTVHDELVFEVPLEERDEVEPLIRDDHGDRDRAEGAARRRHRLRSELGRGEVTRVAPTVYVASPLGFTPAGRRYSEDEILPAVAAAGLVAVDPWMLTPEVDAALSAALVLSDGPDRRTSLAEVDRRIGKVNADLIRAADGMLAVLDGTDVDSGTAAEIGFASALGKVVVGLRTDLRRAGDNDGAIVNLQVEYFIRATGGPIVTDLQEAVLALARVLTT